MGMAEGSKFDSHIDSATLASGQSPQEISNSLFHAPNGFHYLILYPKVSAFRNIYTDFIKKQMAQQPNSVILFLTFYETIEYIRTLLSRNGINTKAGLIISDIMQVIQSQFFKVPVTIKVMTKELEFEIKREDKNILVIADMSVFNHIKKSAELLEYEKNLHKDLKVEGWKVLCCYHKKDFDLMFTEEQKTELLEYHKNRIINV